MSEDSSLPGPKSTEGLLARLIELHEAGADEQVEQLLARHPELAQPFEDLLALQDAGIEAEGAPPTPEGSVFYHRRPTPIETAALATALIDLKPGDRFDEFVLVRRIAQGGMGQVWEAHQKSLRRRVALKFIRPDRADPRTLALFAREARAAGRVNDPRIVTVHATGQTGGVHWIAQEYVPGEFTLADFLADVAEEQRLPSGYFQHVARLFADIAEALHVAHQADIVHRDIKPGNILITPDDRPKVADFGLARLVDEASLTGSQTQVGTPSYMSPEQVSGSNYELDRRSDVFSLGAVLYQLLTRKLPFAASTREGLFARIALADPVDPRRIEPHLPLDLATIVSKALEKRPADRYQTMAELAADLRRYLADEHILARPPSTRQRMRKWVRRHPAASVGSVLFVVLGLTVWLALMQAAHQRGMLRDEQKRLHLRQASFDIEGGRLRFAAAEIDAFDVLDSSDPAGHLVLAAGYGRYGRFTEATAEIEKARAKGYRPNETSGSPQDLYLIALGIIAEPSSAGLKKAAELIERATSLQPELREAWWPLYYARRFLGDTEGAKQALQGFRGALRTEAPEVLLVDALMAELDGAFDRSLALLEQLERRVDRQQQIDLRLDRQLARIRLALYQQGGRDDLLELGERDAARGLQAFPDDTGALACLALAKLERARKTSDPSAAKELLADAETRAERAANMDPSFVMPLEILARIALKRVAEDFDRDNARLDLDHVDRAEARQERLMEVDASNELGREMAADLAFFQAVGAQRRGERDLAFELYEESVQAYAEELPARVRLGMACFNWKQDPRRALSVLTEALALWDAEQQHGNPTRWDRRWLFGLLAYLVGSADRCEDVKLAIAARDRMLEELEEDGARSDLAEVFTFAEFIALPVHPEVKDCASALRLLSEQDIEQHYVGKGGDPERILQEIHAACPQ